MKKILLAACATAALAGAAPAAVLNYTAVVNGEQAARGDGTGSAATGTATLAVDDVARTLDFRLDVEGITLEQLAAIFKPGGMNGALGPIHIHDGDRGENGPIVIPFVFDGSYAATDIGFVLDRADYAFETATGIAGAPVDFDAFVAALDAGGYYVNVHTEDFGGGEIRGQIAPVPLPAGGLLILTGLGALVAMRRRKAAVA